jgi:hypothetical protein
MPLELWMGHYVYRGHEPDYPSPKEAESNHPDNLIDALPSLGCNENALPRKVGHHHLRSAELS